MKRWTDKDVAEACREATIIERNRCARLVPTNWCDPLLTGPKASLKHPVDSRGIEALLRGIQDRIRNSKSE